MPQPGVYDRSYDDIMREAKEALRFGGSTPAPVAPKPIAAPAPVDNSLWGRIKRVANYSPLPEDIGDQFANAVDNPRDRGEGFGAELKSGLAGAGKGFFDLLRSTGTPAGLATLGNPESVAGKVAAGVGSTVFTGEGLENFGREGASGSERALGAAQALMGLLGMHGAVSGGGPHAPAPVAEKGPIPFKAQPEPLASSSHVPYRPDSTMPMEVGTENWYGHPEMQPIRVKPESGLPSPVQEPESFITSEQPPVAEQPSVDTSAPVSTKPRLAAQEVADMLAGRNKFASANPDVTLAPGVRDELDRSGLEYGRTQRELKRLLGMPDADPAEVARMQQGARELGSRLRGTAKAATIPPLPPELEALNGELGDLNAPAPPPETPYAGPERRESPELGKAAREANDPRTQEMMRRAGDRVARLDEVKQATQDKLGSTGGELPDAVDSPQFQAEFGPRDFLGNEAGSIDPALLKFLARPAIGAAAGAAFGDPEHRGRDTAIGAGLGALTGAVSPERLRYASMLTGLAQVKNIAGDVGIVGHTAAERALTHGAGEGANVLKEFFSPQTAHDYIDMLKGDKDVSLNRLDRPESVSSEGVTGLPFRTMGAADTATQNALGRAGVPDAADRTFTGDPKTDVSKAALQFQRKGGAFARFLVPFLKTAASQTEAGVLPVRDLLTRMGELSPAEQKQVLAKVGLLGAGGAAGAAYGSTEFSDNHPKTTALLTAMMGPTAVPAVLGAATSASVRHDRNPYQTAKAIGKAAFDQLPLPSDWISDPGLAAKSLAPAGLDMLNPDDTPRDTSHGIFDALLSRIPFLSQTLPAKSSGKKTRHHYTND